MSAFVTRNGNQLKRYGTRFRGIMTNWYGLIHSNYSLAQYRTIMSAAKNTGLIGFRSWCFDKDATPTNTTGNFRYITPAGSNLLSNPDFESGTSTWQLGTDFSRVSDGNTHSGSFAIKQVSTGGFDNFTTTNDATGITVQANTDYVFWMYAKVQITSGLGPIVQVNSGSAFGTTLNSYGSLNATLDVNGNPGFQKIGFVFNSGNNTKVWIRIFNNNGTVTCYYDDFNISKLGGTVNWVESTFVALDKCLAAAREQGLVMVLPIIDQWGGQQEYYNYMADQLYGLTGQEGGDKAKWQFFTRTNTKQLYKDFIDKLSQRVNTINGLSYQQDDTIIWELGNELRFQAPNDTNQNTSTSANFTTMGKANGWVDTMSAYFKSKFPNHLISAGDIGHFYTWYSNDPVYNGTQPYGVDFQVTGALTNNEVNDFHMYPTEDYNDFRLRAYGQKIANNGALGRTEAGLLSQLNDFATKSKTTNTKPLVIGELGLDKRNTKTDQAIPLYPRSDFVTYFADKFFDVYDGDLLILWHGTTSLFDDNNYNILIDGTSHTGGNANSNSNDSDAGILSYILTRSQSIAATDGPPLYDHSHGGAVAATLA